MRWGLPILATLVTLGALGAWQGLRGDDTAHAADPAPQQSAVPVTVTRAQTGDVPVYLDGLGTVQAFNTVEIKAQVSGTLVGVPVHEGQEVRKGEVVAVIDPTPYQAALDQATAQRAEDAAQLQSAQLDLQRYQSLATHSFAPVQQVDDQRGAVAKDAAAVALDNAAIETARFNLSNSELRAPIDGRIGLYQTDIGNLIQAASQTGIVAITQDKPIAVVFTLPEAELPQVQQAQARGAVPVAASDSRDAAKQFATGTLLAPNNTIDAATGTIALKAEFPNQDDRLWPGAFVRARVQVNTLHHAVTLPDLAVQHGPDGLFVYVVKPDNTVAQVPVTVGYQDGGRSVVTKGLAGNETVVLSGQSRLSPGAHVAPKPASPVDASNAATAPAGNATNAG
jgi:multidrug efflux system membrane fusion protein